MALIDHGVAALVLIASEVPILLKLGKIKMNLKSNRSRFSNEIWLTAFIFLVLAMFFGVYVFTEKMIDRANERRQLSYLLTDQLRQSSDDLTRMGRTYVMTGDSRYRKYYQEILDIRNGKIQRPENYFYAYWDLVVANRLPAPEETGQSIALLDLMRQTGFTEEELGKLSQAKASSDELAALEFEAMKLVESPGTDQEADRSKARHMLYDANYLQAKANIMLPINEVYRLADERTLASVHEAEYNALVFRWLFITGSLGAFFLLWRSHRALNATLGCTASEIQAHMRRIALGDLSSAITIPAGLGNSVLAGLSEMQNTLYVHEIERKKAQTEISHLVSRLSAILGGANYSIIAADYDGLITDFNKAAERMLGYRADEMIRKKTPEIIHDRQEVAKHAEKLSRELGYAVKPGFEVFVAKAKLGRAEEREWTYIRKDGTRFPVMLSVTAIFDEEKRIVGFMGIASDITERKKAEDDLRIAAVTFETHEAIMITDANANILRVNHAFEDITGFSTDEVIGKNPRILSSGRHDKAFYEAMWHQMLGTGIWEGEIWDRRKSGQIYPKWLTITALKDAQGKPTEYIAIFTDITDRKQAEEEIRNLAFYDPLTKLPNRRLLLDRLNSALAASERSKQYGSLLFLDMDKFKSLNDLLGHTVGDQMLVEVAARIKFSVREMDTVSRFGGDEFVVLFENLGEDVEDASQKVALIAEDIRAALAIPFHFSQHVHTSSPSIGVCMYRGHAVSSDNLIKRADIAMYQAKSAGRNRVQFFDPALQLSVEGRAALESDLRHALSNRQLQLFYQVQCDNNGKPFGAEALIRWQHPERGMISPAQFIPIAEESTLILDIGNWVLDTACRQLAAWDKNAATRNLLLAINVSAHQFMMASFLESLQTMVRTYGIEPSRLKLELTETVILHDIENVVNKMQLLKALGIRLSLDDFGTGYSSLSYLKRLPIDQIKIDQSFVRDIVSDKNDAVMVKNIIDIANNFNLNVIAEGVENEEQLEFLKQNGCMAFQGYLFGKPIPIAQFEERLIRKNGD